MEDNMPVYQFHNIRQAHIAVVLVDSSTQTCSRCWSKLIGQTPNCPDCNALFVAEQALKYSGGPGMDRRPPDFWARLYPNLPYFNAFGEFLERAI